MSAHTNELRQLSPDALRTKAEELQREIRTLSFNRFHQTEKNVRRLRALRHDLARVLTILTERVKTDRSSSAV